MQRPETTILILLSVLTVSAHTVTQPSQDTDVNVQLNDLTTKQKGFEEKLQQQTDLITKQAEIIREQRQDFEENLQRQGDLIQSLTGEVSHNKVSIRQLKKQLQTARKEKDLWQYLFQTGIEDEQLRKRAVDLESLEIVVNQVSQRLNEVTAEIQTLKNENENLRNTVAGGGGSVYVRWGSSTCVNTTQLIYSGLMGGSYFSQEGSATNQLCLPPDPVYSVSSQGSNMSHGYAELYGGEYAVDPELAQDLDAVCAVCQSSRSTTLMIPATNTCYPGWSLEYSGYIMAGHPGSDRAGSEFVCVDSKIEGRPETEADTNGFLLYYTRGHCGSLPCPPYVEGNVVTCVVCSK